MLRKDIFAVLFLCWSSLLISQNEITLLEKYESLIEDEQYNAYEKKHVLDSLINNSSADLNQDHLAHIYHDLLKAFYKRDITISITYALKIKAIGESLNDQGAFYLKNDKNLVNLYYMKGDYHKSITFGEEFLRKHPSETIRQAIVYRVLGNSYSDLGDFMEAISHYNKAIYIFKEYNELKEEGRTLINLLEVYVKLDNKSLKNDVLEIIMRFDKIDKGYEFSKNDVLKKELNAGAFYDCIQDYKNAKIRYTKSLELSKELSDSLNICNSLINLGIANRKEGKLESSNKMFISAMPYANDNNVKKASIYNNLADVYKEEKNYSQALEYYNNAITEFLQLKHTSIFDVPDIEMLKSIDNKVDLLGYIIDKANVLLLIKQEKFKTQYLQLALNLYALSDLLVDVIYYESREDFSKLFWREEASNFYLNATEVAFYLNKVELAFHYIEKSKAILLLENITTSKAKVLANLPENLINREYDHISNIKKAEEALFSLKKTAQNIEIVDSLKNEVFSKKQEYTLFIDSLEMAYPRYHSFKKKIAVYDSKMVQESLKPDEIVLQYKLSQDKGFVVVLAKSYEQIFPLENVTQIHEHMDQYIDLTSKPFVDYQDQERFKDISHKLYLALFPSIEKNKDMYSNKKLIIIPDSKLYYVPFESFVTDNKQDLTASYLINFCDISYAYSYSSLDISHDDEFEKDFFAISPSVFEDTSLSSLLISESDSKNIEVLLNTNIVSNKEATRQRFLDEYGKSKIVHISTHGGVLNNEPWISFNDQRLMLNDIYFKNQNANLVVLSACKTSHGELKKGEGVMSIARAFISSGSKSVVSSLWDINQRSTNEIITTFYSNLKAGDSKSEALRNAKLSYINNHKNTSEASPFYWSSLVLTGDTEAVFDDNKNLWYILPVFVIIGIIGLVFKPRRSNLNI